MLQQRRQDRLRHAVAVGMTVSESRVDPVEVWGVQQPSVCGRSDREALSEKACGSFQEVVRDAVSVSLGGLAPDRVVSLLGDIIGEDPNHAAPSEHRGQERDPRHHHHGVEELLKISCF